MINYRYYMCRLLGSADESSTVVTSSVPPAP